MNPKQLIAALKRTQKSNPKLDFWLWWWLKANRGNDNSLPDADYVKINIKHGTCPRYTADISAAISLLQGSFTIGSGGIEGAMASVGNHCVRHRNMTIAVCIVALQANEEIQKELTS